MAGRGAAGHAPKRAPPTRRCRRTAGSELLPGSCPLGNAVRQAARHRAGTRSPAKGTDQNRLKATFTTACAVGICGVPPWVS